MSATLCGMCVAPAAAQARRSSVSEASAGITTVMARGEFWGGELSLALRPAGGGQTRFQTSAAAGRYEGAAALRLGVSGQFVLRPGGRTGVSPYAGLGLAFAGASGVRGAAYLTATLGLEASPARPQGWYAELGLGGGVRLGGGWRWRRLPP